MGNDLFEKAPIPKAYFSFALPVVFSMVISLVYNMADTYFMPLPEIRIWLRVFHLAHRFLR